MDRNRTSVKLRVQPQFVDSESDSDSVSSVESKQLSTYQIIQQRVKLSTNQDFRRRYVLKALPKEG